MQTQDGKLKISATLSNDELLEFAKQIVNEIDDIKSVEIDENIVESSALFALLGSIKKSNPNINIPIMDELSVNVNGIGNVTIRKGEG